MLILMRKYDWDQLLMIHEKIFALIVNSHLKKHHFILISSPNSSSVFSPEKSCRHLLSITASSLSLGNIIFIFLAISHTPGNESTAQSKSFGAIYSPLTDIFLDILNHQGKTSYSDLAQMRNYSKTFA